MRYKYFICDVFTDEQFGGNQLAVLPEASGLTTELMQKIAREFNFSESTFVFPPEQGHCRKVRIFTPTIEVPFAGHPNVGTAFALVTAGEFGDIGSETTLTFEEEAGLVPVYVKRTEKGYWCELKAPEAVSLGDSITSEFIAEILCLETADIITELHPPQVASVGLPFLMVQLKDLGALERARINGMALDKLKAQGVTPDIHLYIKSHDEFDIRARMFAPLDGVPEDPATGSANCALVGMLTHYESARDGDFQWRIAQGVEMGRPSLLQARTQKRDGEVAAVFIGGDSVLVSEGHIEVS